MRTQGWRVTNCVQIHGWKAWANTRGKHCGNGEVVDNGVNDHRVTGRDENSEVAKRLPGILSTRLFTALRSSLYLLMNFSTMRMLISRKQA